MLRPRRRGFAVEGAPPGRDLGDCAIEAGLRLSLRHRRKWRGARCRKLIEALFEARDQLGDLFGIFAAALRQLRRRCVAMDSLIHAARDIVDSPVEPGVIVGGAFVACMRLRLRILLRRLLQDDGVEPFIDRYARTPRRITRAVAGFWPKIFDAPR